MNVWLVLLVGVPIAAALYVGHCAIWPYAACRKCEGSGRRRSPSGRAWRTCRRCDGSGSRVRLGRRLWEIGRRS